MFACEIAIFTCTSYIGTLTQLSLVTVVNLGKPSLVIVVNCLWLRILVFSCFLCRNGFHREVSCINVYNIIINHGDKTELIIYM